MTSSPMHAAFEPGRGPRSVALPSAESHGFHSPATKAILFSYPRGGAGRRLQFHTFDASYVENLCAGDGATQEHFVAYFTELLRIKLRSRLDSLHAIEDVCQETFARVFAVLRKDGGLRQPERLGAFVNSICNHVLFETYRSSSRTDPLPELPATGMDALDIVAARQMKEKVREILLDLAPRDRSLLKAVFLDERDRDEVCLEFGVDREYLRVLLHRAKQEFKNEYVRRIGNPTPLALES
jgi:RNA polymerase sigma-70 factor (ECF subfamily)